MLTRDKHERPTFTEIVNTNPTIIGILKGRPDLVSLTPTENTSDSEFNFFDDSDTE